MSKKIEEGTKPEQIVEDAPINPLEGYSTAIETLIWLARWGETDATRMEAAQSLLAHSSCPPDVDWGVDFDGDDG